MAAKKPDPLAIAQKAAGTQRKMRTWLDDLDPATRTGVIDVAKRIANGTMRNQSAIVRAWADAGIPVTLNRLVCLINRIKDGSL